jgi:hypothetical protein
MTLYFTDMYICTYVHEVINYGYFTLPTYTLYLQKYTISQEWFGLLLHIIIIILICKADISIGLYL